MTHNIEQLRTLRDRVAKLAGPDRDVDDEIDITLNGFSRDGEGRLLNKAGSRAIRGVYPGITESIDAVEALRQRLLPGWFLESEQVRNIWMVALFSPLTLRRVYVEAPTEPLARLLALLDALIAQHPSDADDWADAMRNATEVPQAFAEAPDAVDNEGEE